MIINYIKLIGKMNQFNKFKMKDKILTKLKLDQGTLLFC